MNKAELVNNVAHDSGLQKATVASALNHLIEEIKHQVKEGETAALVGFGTFSPVNKAARDYRNPQTQGVVHKPAHTVVKFKPSKTFLGE